MKNIVRLGTLSLDINGRGIEELLKSPEVQADLKARAERIAAAAGAEEHNVHSEIGPNRARAAVVTGTPRAMVREGRDRNLTRSVDAGR